MSQKLSGALLALSIAILPAYAAAGQGRFHKNPFVGVPVTGTASDGSRFTGTVDIHQFVTDQLGRTAAVGVLNGMLGSRQVSNVVVTLPVAPGTGTVRAQAITCDILELTLGPLDLDLLGLTVHLDVVHLVIDAVPGAGNLLGNLLCAITNLLNGGLLGNILTALLNQLLNMIFFA
jgi:hypothetical protein